MTTLLTSEAPTRVERVSIRDIRESSYRALVAHGASHGEAATAADQVLHAELHSGSGLTALLADLAMPAWPQTGMTLTQPAAASSLEVSVVSGAGRGNLLRAGCLLTDLAASRPDPARVVCSPDITTVDATIDFLLLEAASLTGQAVAAVLVTEDGRPGIARVGDPAGGAGPIDEADVLSDHIHDALRRPLPTGGVAILRASKLKPGPGWVTADAYASRRREAAAAGVLVDADAWPVTYAAARGFLVPEA